MGVYSNIQRYKNPKTNTRYYTNVVYPEIVPTANDLYIYTSYEDRLDLLAYDYYGNSNLYWIISSANPDITRRDSFFIKGGVQIRIPSPDRIDAIIRDFEDLNKAR